MKPPYLVFLGDAANGSEAKTAAGVHHWRPDQCLAEHALPEAEFTLGLPRKTPQEAAAAGARTMILGTVSGGGVIASSWRTVLLEALTAGLNVASGMHQFLADDEELAAAAQSSGAEIFDVRRPPVDLPIGRGEPRAGHRILTVGTDCNVGKMYTTLALEAELRQRGYDAHFKATGQTGILVTGEGVPLDAVVADFISGAVEQLSPAAPGEWHLIEGQGSLQHPAFAGVTLGLIHGAQPDWLVVCSDPGRRIMRQTRAYPVPSLRETLDSALESARLTSPNVQALGCSLNTSKLDEATARQALDAAEDELGLPAVDPVRTGVGRLADGLPAPA